MSSEPGPPNREGSGWGEVGDIPLGAGLCHSFIGVLNADTVHLNFTQNIHYICTENASLQSHTSQRFLEG